MALWTDFREALRQPEYLHVLLNPLPVYGLAVGIIALIAAGLARSRPALILALALVAFTAAAAGPAAYFGHAGYDRVYSLSSAEAQAWLNWHRHLGERVVWLYYLAAALAGWAWAAVAARSRWRRLSLTLALASAVAALVGGSLLAFAGGKIRHDEFRDHPPPPWADTSSPDA